MVICLFVKDFGGPCALASCNNFEYLICFCLWNSMLIFMCAINTQVFQCYPAYWWVLSFYSRKHKCYKSLANKNTTTKAPLKVPLHSSDFQKMPIKLSNQCRSNSILLSGNSFQLIMWFRLIVENYISKAITIVSDEITIWLFYISNKLLTNYTYFISISFDVHMIMYK